MIRSGFARQAATLVSGSATAQLILLAAMPVISRLFDPSHFGVSAVFVIVVTLLSDAASMRYYRAALITKDTERSNQLTVLSIKTLQIGSLVVFLLFALHVFVGLPLPLPGNLGLWIWVIPVGMIVAGTGQIMAARRMRVKEFKVIAFSDLGNSLFTTISRILFGLSGSSVWGLIFGYLTGQLGRLFILRKHRKASTSLPSQPAQWADLKALAIEYKDFPLYNMPTGFIRGLSQNLPILIMGVMFEPAAVGFYAMGDRLVRRPVSLIGRPVRDVFLVRGASIINDKKKIHRLFTKVTLWLFLLGLLPFGALTLYGDSIIDFLLGARWKNAGAYIQILAPWYFSAWVIMGVQPVLVVLRRQAIMLRVQIITLIIRGSVFMVAYFATIDVKLTLTWFSGINILVALGVLTMTFYLISHHQPEKSE